MLANIKVQTQYPNLFKNFNFQVSVRYVLVASCQIVDQIERNMYALFYQKQSQLKAFYLICVFLLFCKICSYFGGNMDVSLIRNKKYSFYNYRFRRMQKQQSLKENLSTINRSPLNTSKSKAMFSFPRGGRFPDLNVDSNYHFYQKESQLDKRAPSFGYGHKIDIALKNNSPSPDKYTLASDFSKSPKQGLTIGHGRQDCKSVSIFNQTNNPGPGNYNLQREGQNIKNKTMGSKLKFPSLWVSSIAPGPGAYEVQKVDSNGFCLTSKYKTKNSFRIHPKSPQKQNKVAQMIGPGTYNTNLSSTGKQLLARNKTEKSFVFSKKVRQTMNESSLSPGPGAYQHFSMFGMV